MGLHTSCSHASDLFLIYKETAACTLRCFHLKKSQKGSICANSVILSIASDHAAVKTTVTSLASWNDLKLCGKEIFLFHTIFLIQNAKYILLNSLFLLVIRKILQRLASNQDIQLLALNSLRSLLRHLLSSKMNQKVCNVKNRIILILADGYIYNSAILLHNYAMHCHWKSNPLIFLHSTVVMSVKISQIRILI